MAKVDAERAAWAAERALLRAELEAWRARDAGMARAMGDLAEGSMEGSGALAEVEARVAIPLERIGAAFERAKLSPRFTQVSQGAAGPEFAGKGGCSRTTTQPTHFLALAVALFCTAPATDIHWHPRPRIPGNVRLVF